MNKLIEDKNIEKNRLKNDLFKINTEIASMESKVMHYSNELFNLFKMLQINSNEVDKYLQLKSTINSEILDLNDQINLLDEEDPNQY